MPVGSVREVIVVARRGGVGGAGLVRSAHNQQLNVQTLRGLIAELNALAPQATVGTYSFRPMWRQITGGWTINLPEWISQANGSNACQTPFSTGPVWLSQGGSASLDTDRTC